MKNGRDVVVATSPGDLCSAHTGVAEDKHQRPQPEESCIVVESTINEGLN